MFGFDVFYEPHALLALLLRYIALVLHGHVHLCSQIATLLGHQFNMTMSWSFEYDDGAVA